MKALQTIAAETISNCVLKKKHFELLEVPKPLLADLNEAYDNIWRVNLKCYICKGNLEDTDIVQCPSNMTHLFCFTCCWNFIFYKRHKFFKQNSEVFCPSDERCPLRGSTEPWTLALRQRRWSFSSKQGEEEVRICSEREILCLVKSNPESCQFRSYYNFYII